MTPPPVSADFSHPAVIPAAVAPLRHTGYLEIDGADAASFLQGQLSNDVTELAIGSAQWTSYNSPKGRMLATMLLWRASATSYRAFVAADLAESLRKRLAMFVMRAKVTVVDRTPVGRVFGLTGSTAQAIRMAVNDGCELAREAGERRDIASEVDIVATPDGRVLVFAPAEHGDLVETILCAVAQPVEPTHWDWSGIAAGVPTIAAATQDLFIPQAANWDLVGGVNFRKGCYPGQEIVARMQYLGKLKERLFRLHHAGDPPQPGTTLYSAVFGDQACGTVVNAAPAPTGGSDLLAVAQAQAVAQSPLHLGAPDGPALTLLDLPYAIPAQVAPNRPKLA